MMVSDMTLSNRPNPDIVELDRNSVWHHLTQHKAFETKDPMVIVKGKGMIVTDINDREYLDATSGGVWSVNVGYGRETIAKAVSDQLVKMCYFAGSAGTEPGAIFADKMLEKVPGLSRVYYSNSGSEANEKGYKMVRQLSHIEGDGTKHKVLYRNRDYHGTTIGALSSTGQEQRKADFGPFAPGFAEFANCCCFRCPFGKKYGECNIECAQDLERAILEEGPETVGSVVVEPITAGGGVIVPPPEYRFKADAENNMSYFRDISTFGGCTGGPAAAIEALRIVEDEKLVTNAKNIGAYFMDALHGLKEKHEVIGDVRGKGLLNGLELVANRDTKDPVPEQFAAAVAANCKEEGLIIGRTNRSFATLNNTLCFAPALIAGKSEIDEIVDKLDKSLTKTAQDHSALLG